MENQFDSEETVSHFLSDSENDPSPVRNERYRRNRKNERYCGNCGRKGHLYRECTDDITSFGVIALRRMEEDKLTESDKESYGIVESVKKTEGPPLRVLLVQRKDTMGFVDFIRGRYPDTEPYRTKQIKILLEEMVPEERTRIATQKFDQLWDELWINHTSKCYKNEKDGAKAKFEKLDIKGYLEATSTTWKFTEFGIPKGRRNMKETNKQCAEREFREETGYLSEHYRTITTEPYIQETFTGTNGKRYKHIYFIAEVLASAGPPKIDYNNKNQIGEIKDVKWFTEEECLQVIRSYDTAKKKVLEKIFRDFSNFG